MNFFVRHRPTATERITWLLLALLLGLTLRTQAQGRQPARRSAGGSRTTRVLNDDPLIHNHGSGVRVGVILAQAKRALKAGNCPAVFELGGYHQRALGKVGSWQVEGLFFRQLPTAGGAPATGLRLPLLLVLNPFDNVSLHLGPQAQWQWNTAPVFADGRVERPAPALTAGFVIGAEARASIVRGGLRYGTALGSLTDLPALGADMGDAWKGGQLQVYLGLDIDEIKW